jgi:hypothetical protein
MKKNKFLKVLSKKSLIHITAAVAISGLIPVGVALAQGELVAELVAEQGVTISGKPGDIILVPVNIYVTSRGTNVTSAVTVSAHFEGKPVKSVSFEANQFNVKKQVFLEYTIPMTTASTVSPRVFMTSTDTTGNDQVNDLANDYVTIQVIQSPADTTAPTISLTNPLSGFYNASTLPSTFVYDLDEDGEVFVNGVSQGTISAGSHELSLPTSNEGSNTVTLTAKDAAGNVSNETSFSYFYDTVDPNVIATPDREANEYGWYKEDVTVSFSATDDGSGVNAATLTAQVTVTSDGVHVITGSASDYAGNAGSASLTVNLDKTAPSISGIVNKTANSAGWYNENVIVSFTADDALSGVASVTEPITLTEGEGNSAIGTATDKAGNQSTTRLSGINIDTSKPVITVEDGGIYTLNQVVGWTATDDISGLATAEAGTVDTSSVGPQDLTIIATDIAGNTIEKTIHYNVVYDFGGFLQPLIKGGTYKAGSTIPVKFQLKDAYEAYISNARATINYAKVTNNVVGSEVVAISTSAASTGNQFRYDSTANQYIFNLSTKGMATGTYQITITLNDGTTKSVQFSLK